MHWIAVFLLCVLAELSSAQRKIVGGTTASISAHPYQVAITSKGRLICGGTIVDPNTILTAAHCVDRGNVNDLAIRAGSSQWSSGGTVIKAQSYQKHPRFNRNNLAYDVALIHLAQNLPVSDSIKPIPLYNRKLFGGRIATATGWGTLREGGSLPETLHKVSFPIQNRRICRRAYGALPVPEFCAGRMAGGVDTCQGDSGGPLVMNGYLVGVTSNGNGCGRRGYPGLYTKVPLIRNWVLNNLNR